MILSLMLIRTRTCHRYLVYFRRQVRIGLDETSDVLVNHPVFRGKASVFGSSDHREPKAAGNKGILRHFFSIHRLAAENLSIKMFSPGWAAYMALFLVVTVLMICWFAGGWGSGRVTQDWAPIPMPAPDTYGFCRQDSTHPDGVRFVFDATEIRPHNLVFTSGSDGKEAHLTLSLNGQRPFPSIQLPSGWGKETVFRLPADMIDIGPNRIEFLAKGPAGDTSRWGVQNVRVVVPDEVEMDSGNIISALDSIRSLLHQGNPQSPQELARNYRIVESIQASEETESIVPDIMEIKTAIENRMEAAIRDTLVRSRAARIMGDEKLASQILKDSRMWIPENWTKGLEALNGTGRRD